MGKIYFAIEVTCTLVLCVDCFIFCFGSYCFVSTLLPFSSKTMNCYTHILYFYFINYFIVLLLLVRVQINEYL